MSTIHPTAVIAPSARLGEGVTVGPYAIIEDDVEIGDGCRIDSHAVIKNFTRMGRDNHIHSHAVVGDEPQDLKFRGERSELLIGNGNRIREFATLHRGTEGGGGVTRVGDNNLLMAYVHIAHDCELGSSIVMSNGATLGGHVQVGDSAIVGGLSAVHQFCRIGCHAFVGGMTGVAQDLPPWMLAAGSRALVHGPNLVGIRRAGLGREHAMALKAAFRFLWRSDLPRTEALVQIEKAYPDLEPVRSFVTFVRASERGVCPAEKMGGTEKNDDGELDESSAKG